MRLKSIETTPNPNSMKLNLDQSVGKSVTYTKKDSGNCPEYVENLLNIEGVQSVFACNDFITMNRDPRVSWKSILDEATRLMSDSATNPTGSEEKRISPEASGQVAVFVQTFRGIPIQVKITDPDGETRLALDSRFSDAAQLIQAKSGADYLKERYWADWGVRYGTREVVAAEVVEEIQGTIGGAEISARIANALDSSTEKTAARSHAAIMADLSSDDWHRRLAAVQELGASNAAVPSLIDALQDPHPQVRRLVAAALGASGNHEAVSPLAEALLHDDSVAVRRTAGDALSDLGDVAAQPAMCKALTDPNKLVRWRAARFLTDVGTDEALPFLNQATDDPEFEVRLEIEAAIERISGGKEVSMPAWKKILNTRIESND